MRTTMVSTFADVFFAFNSRQARVWRDAALVVGASLFVALCAKIRIGGPIPFTMQPWAVILVGATLGSWRGALALAAYLMEGLCGLPVFAGATAGPAYLMSQTGGYLAAFPVAAFVTGWFTERGWDRRFLTAASALGMGSAVILIGGFAWLAGFVGPGLAWKTGVLPFLMGDVLKVVMAACALPAAWKIVGRDETKA